MFCDSVTSVKCTTQHFFLFKTDLFISNAMMEAIKASKTFLRQEIKHKLQSLSVDYKKQQSEIVVKKLISLPLFNESKRISVYLSTDNEINTEPILRRIFDSNKKCYVPRYNKQVMEMVKLDSMKDFETLPITKWNIKQPSLSEERENALETGGLDLIIVPGMAFTSSGARLGHGKGYYDIFLGRCRATQEIPPRTIGLAFREQLCSDIPCHDHDVCLDVVIGPDEDDDDIE